MPAAESVTHAFVANLVDVRVAVLATPPTSETERHVLR
jgi:hypothetical protein